MIRSTIVRTLLAGTALLSATQAYAQEAQEAQPDPSDATADAAIAAAQEVSDAEAKLQLLQAQVEALQDQVENMKSAMVKATPSWKGAPQVEDKDAGFSFKPKGFMQFDAGYVGYPDGNDTLAGPSTGAPTLANLGFNLRARRLVLGAEGSLPGGFKYKAEFNFAQGAVDYEDITLSYDFKNSPLTLTVGNFYPYSSLETVTSSRLGSMLERASFTDAFNYNRRLGIGLSLADKTNDRYTLSAGVFGAGVNDASFTRTSWEASARGTYSPKIGDNGLIHLGLSAHHRVNTREAQGQQYRTRPLTQITDQRFIDTGTIASTGDDSVGVEVGGVFKSLHMAAEAQKLWVRGYRPGEAADGGATSAISGQRYNGDPSLWGGYFEMGFYLTGETRGYKSGKWERTKVLKPFDKGGWGAFQVNGRIDYVDLDDRFGGVLAGSGYNPGSNATLLNGGKQLGTQVSLIWNPTDYLRFMAQAGRVNVEGGPRTLSLFPASDTTPLTDRDYTVDSAAVRAQLDF